MVTIRDLGALQWRWVGPAVMGGRLDVVAGVPGNPRIIYLGHSSGGLFKSTDGGLTFTSIFSEGTSTAIGALAVSESNPNVIYIGTGEGFPRNTASPGDGIFKSTNAGKTWKYVGLGASEHIAKIAIDPRNPNVAIVAALGPEWRPGGERGIYRTQDGGKTWQRVLFGNATTGGSDVAFDPQNPQIVFAGTFDFIRRPWTFRGGGPGSGLFKSVDNGQTWERLTDPTLHNGLPGGLINRVGVALSYYHPNVVYALVPTKTGLLYRSGDSGVSWKLVNAHTDLDFRPFYFSQVRVDPRNPKLVYIVSGDNYISHDGGKTFSEFEGGGDNHDIWIDPRDPERLLDGSDMGFELSVNGGTTWSYINTVPFAQIYRVGYDLAIPYHVMGGMQDHEVWWGPNSLWNGFGVPEGAWRKISDWGDGQYAKADPRDPNIIYEDTHFGDLVRLNLRTGDSRNIAPQPLIGFGTGAGTFRYRFNWSAPLYISPHDPNVVYFGGNVLFKTVDGGASWQVMSPDLSRPCDPQWLAPSGGPISRDDTNAETYCTIYAISEDASDPNTLWVGTDNGNLDITRDGGVTWTNVIGNVPNLPAAASASPRPGSWVASIDASRTAPGVAYVAFDRHVFGDNHSYAYFTTDYGRTWHNISRGLRGYVHVVREDPRQTNLLFAGTEQGVFGSFDRGKHWISLMLGMPPVPVYDLQIQPVFNDLILGTHGRGFYILDDITPLEGLASAVDAPLIHVSGSHTSPSNSRAVRPRVVRSPTLFTPQTAWRYTLRPTYEFGRGGFVSDNKPYGAIISYYLPPTAAKGCSPPPSCVKAVISSAAPKLRRRGKRLKPLARKKSQEHVTLHILNAQGTIIRTLDATAKPGINRVVWDLTVDPPGGKKAVQDSRDYYVFYPLYISGPEVLPGVYTVQLIARGKTEEASLAVKLDPDASVSTADLQKQYDALWQLADAQERGEVALSIITELDRQIANRHRRARELKIARSEIAVVNGTLAAYQRQLDRAADQLRNGNGSQNAGYKRPGRLIDDIAYLRHILALSLNAPTQAQAALAQHYEQEMQRMKPLLHALFVKELREINKPLAHAKLQPLHPKETRAAGDGASLL